MINRRNLLSFTAAALTLSACGRQQSGSDDILENAKEIIAAKPSLDLHAHPGLTFIRNAVRLAPSIEAFTRSGPFEERVVADMLTGGVTAAVFAAVSDFQILDFKGAGLVATRAFAPGEALASYKTQIANLQSIISTGLAAPILSPSDIKSALEDHVTGAMLGVEGGDFLEGSASRVEEAFADGVRCITPVHYHTNEIGDIMTANPVHDGLTKAGAEIIRSMNKMGIIVDVAHASEATAFGMLDAAEKPLICSHTHINTEKMEFSRFISHELALEIANGGGVIGAWPAGIGIDSIDGFIDRIFELIDLVGIDHVGIGTDMDANYQPVWDNYRQFPEVVAGMISRGMHVDEISKIIGGNGIRVFNVVSNNT